MSKYRLWRIIGAVFVILLQILMCNRIALWGIATPFVVVYLFLKIPSGLKPHFLMTVSFFIGLLIDVFTNTLGVYALASVTVAFLHNPLLARLQYRDRGEESFVPSFDSLGLWGYMLYTFVLTFVFCTVLFCAESFCVILQKNGNGAPFGSKKRKHNRIWFCDLNKKKKKK